MTPAELIQAARGLWAQPHPTADHLDDLVEALADLQAQARDGERQADVAALAADPADTATIERSMALAAAYYDALCAIRGLRYEAEDLAAEAHHAEELATMRQLAEAMA